MVVTDIIVVLGISAASAIGWHKGIFRTLIGPLSLTLSIITGYIYFTKTDNIGIALLIAIFGQLGYAIVLSIFLSVWNKTVNKNIPLGSISRFLGSLFNVAWAGCMIISVISLIAFIPFKIPGFSKVQDDVLDSYSFVVVNKLIGERFVRLSGFKSILEDIEDPRRMAEIRSMSEFKTLVDDERFQELASDEEILNMIKNQDISKLLENPKMVEFLKDKESVKKIIDFGKNLPAEDEGQKQGSQSLNNPSPPKVYEMQNGTTKVAY